MILRAPAKLNLCLHLGQRREDGLHELCSLTQSLTLADTLTIADSDADSVVCPGVDGVNLASRALDALRPVVARVRHDVPAQSVDQRRRVPDHEQVQFARIAVQQGVS